MSLILGANQLTAGGYEVDNSLRFNSGSSDYLSRTPASTTSQTTWTYSTWIKISFDKSNYPRIFSAGTTTANHFEITLMAEADGSELRIMGDTASSRTLNWTTAMKFRDPSAWYHLVVALDTTQATQSNRLNVYINGSLFSTAGASSTLPSQNDTYVVNSTTEHNIGRSNPYGEYYTGYMSETYLIDGQQLTPTDFGEFDEDSGIWKPIPYAGTYGTNGFYLEFKDSSALGDDTSGNGNDFTVNNLTSIDQTTDTPTNNFATLNPLHSSTSTLSDGNLTVVANTDFVGTFATIGVNKGKWYFEAKINSSVSPQDNYIGVSGDNASTSSSPQSNNPSVLYVGDGSIVKDNSSVQSGLTGFSAGNIIGVALNMDDLEIEFYNNGVKQGSTQSMSAYSGFYLPFYIGANGRTSSWNFGSPPFTISSGNADGAGFGNFEYSVPSGYFALCTKNLAEYG